MPATFAIRTPRGSAITPTSGAGREKYRADSLGDGACRVDMPTRHDTAVSAMAAT